MWHEYDITQTWPTECGDGDRFLYSVVVTHPSGSDSRSAWVVCWSFQAASEAPRPLSLRRDKQPHVHVTTHTQLVMRTPQNNYTHITFLIWNRILLKGNHFLLIKKNTFVSIRDVPNIRLVFGIYIYHHSLRVNMRVQLGTAPLMRRR